MIAEAPSNKQSVNPSRRSSSASHSLPSSSVGTRGIGHYTLRALAKAQVDFEGKGLRAYLVGRELNMATEVIAECNQIYPEAKITFVQVDDLSLITDVDRACAEIFRLEKGEEDPRIDYLMLSQGDPIMMPRRGTTRVSVWEAKSKTDALTDTAEGLNQTMSCCTTRACAPPFSYNRCWLTLSSPQKPYLSMQPDSRQNSSKRTSPSAASTSTVTPRPGRICSAQKTLFLETFAAQNKGKPALVHIFPGLVLGPGFSRLLTMDPWESGERMLALASKRYPPQSECIDSADRIEDAREMVRATNGQPGGGSYALT
ncbi:hypothetical protein BJX65DRAFT_312041 [Aspergillus insuetus]